jgi:hypothetical protein
VDDLRGTIATVNDEVGSGGIGRGIRGQIEVGTLQLVGLTFTTHGNFVTPDVFGIFGNKIGDFGSDVTGRDSVGTSEANPFNGKGFA